MKKLLFGCIIIFVLSCQKEQPQIKCGIITAKYISGHDDPTFEFEGLRAITVSQSVYDFHKVTDYYCY